LFASRGGIVEGKYFTTKNTKNTKNTKRLLVFLVS
jgi:hypothetical protein